MDLVMYNTLNAVPLFMGMNGVDLVNIIHSEDITVDALEIGEIFAHQGESCQRMAILMDGTLSIRTSVSNGQFICQEQLSGPNLLEADILYGIQRTWSSTISAKTECKILLISKSGVSRLTARSEIFRINYFNALCTLASKRRQRIWQTPTIDPQRRLLHFLSTHTMTSQGSKTFTTTTSFLGKCLGVNRKSVSQLLFQLKEKGQINYTRGKIELIEIQRTNQFIYNEDYT